ncbi:MAG: hypothetical protein A2075_13285 [Geobacteraceae bacterium GWC2_58_44]|nr:MAG: hypothetical protein A2075_13285 [Geobacteraceae bacterium GWC2_58_44]HBG08228.1 hypothetical protein [Geobacter sp.]
MVMTSGMRLRWLMMVVLVLSWSGSALAIGIRVVPSSSQAAPGDDIYLDVVAEEIPAEGLGGVQFRLHVTVPNGVASGVQSLDEAASGSVALAAPLLLAPATGSRSGIGAFFWNGRGTQGILALDNEPLVNGSALFTFAHTNGATPPSGSGTVARFQLRVGSEVKPGQINVTLSEVMLLDGGPAYPLDYVRDASVTIPCLTKVPSLLGMSFSQAQAALASADLRVGRSYKVASDGKLPLNVVLEQLPVAGSRQSCQAAVDFAIDRPPADVSQAAAHDKAGDESGAVILSWSPSSAADAAGYRIYRGASLLKEIDNKAATGTEVGWLPPGSPALLRITVYDSFGLESPGVTVSALPRDDVAPAVALGAGKPANPSSQKSGSFDFSSGDSTASFDCKLDAASFALCTTPYAYSNLADGNHSFTVRARDLAGNLSVTPAAYTWRVDTVAPSVVIGSKPAGSSQLKSGSFSFSSSDAAASFQCRIDTASFAACANPYPYSNLADGSHSFSVRAKDLAGNLSTTPAAYTWSIDTVAPNVTIGSKPASSSNLKSGSIAFSSGDGAAGFECKVDAASFALCRTPYSYSNLTDGSHSFAVRAKDAAGNLTATPAAYSWSIDTVPPVTTASPAAGLYSAARSVTLTVSETAAVYYTSDGSQPTKASARYSAPIPVAASTTVKFFAVDAAGNSEAVRSAAYTIDTKAPTTTATPGAGSYSSAQTVTLSATEAGSIYYTTDGSQPTAASAKYGAPISITDSCTLRFFATDAAGNREAVKALAYTVTGRVSLTLTAAGTGSGTVVSTPSALACNAGCSGNFNLGTRVTLVATNSEYSIFTGWGGDCTGKAQCSLLMDANKTVRASFDKDTARSVRLNTASITYYSSLLNAYLAAPIGATIQAFGTEFSESPVFNQKKVVRIKGGYDSGYASAAGVTQIKGKLVIRQGTVRVERVAVH